MVISRAMRRTVPSNASELVDWLTGLFPAFPGHLAASPFIDPHEELTPHRVCMVFTHFYRDGVPDYGAPEVAELFGGIESIIAADRIGYLPVGNAVCTCFLENIGGDAAGELSRRHMGGYTLEFFDGWHGRRA